MAPPLILLSHGSRHPKAHAGVAQLAAATLPLLGPQVGSASIAHLEFHSLTLDRVVGELAAAGERRAVVVPLLFTRGYHSTEDVPEEIRAAERDHGVELILAEGLGSGADLAEILASGARADAAAAARLVLHPVGSTRPQAQADVDALAGLIAERLDRPVEVVPATNATRTLAEVEAEHGRIHVLPLFVTAGLLLDKAAAALGPGSGISAPLFTDLAPVVAARYTAAV